MDLPTRMYHTWKKNPSLCRSYIRRGELLQTQRTALGTELCLGEDMGYGNPTVEITSYGITIWELLNMEHLAQEDILIWKAMHHECWAWHQIPPSNSTTTGCWGKIHVQGLLVQATWISPKEGERCCVKAVPIVCPLSVTYLFIAISTQDKNGSTWKFSHEGIRCRPACCSIDVC